MAGSKYFVRHLEGGMTRHLSEPADLKLVKSDECDSLEQAIDHALDVMGNGHAGYIEIVDEHEKTVRVRGDLVLEAEKRRRHRPADK